MKLINIIFRMKLIKLKIIIIVELINYNLVYVIYRIN